MTRRRELFNRSMKLFVFSADRGANKVVRVVLARLFPLFLFAATTAVALPGIASAEDEVRISNQQLAVFPAGEKLMLISVVNVENRGTDAAPELHFPLPEGAVEFTPMDGWEDFSMGENEVVDRAGLSAGERRQLAFAYEVPVAGERTAVNYPVGYPTESLQVLIPPEYLAVEAEDFLTQSQVRNFNGQSLRQFTRLNLRPGESWPLLFTQVSGETPLAKVDKSVHESGLPVIFHDYGQGSQKAIFNLVFIAVVLLFGFVGVRTSQWRAEQVSRQEARESLYQEREQLLEQLAGLEYNYCHEQLDAETYKKEKARLERQLMVLFPLLEGERSS